jgi:hypothetical protein
VNNEVLALWVKALRSGNYVQCQGDYALHNEYGTPSFCALGVLAEVAYTLGNTDINPFTADYLMLERLHQVIDSDEDELRFQDIINWNDDEQMSFVEIADHLEEIYGPEK